MVAERSVSNPGSLRATRSVFANVDSFLSRDGPKLVYEYSGKRAIEETPAVGDTAWALRLSGGMEAQGKPRSEGPKDYSFQEDAEQLAAEAPAGEPSGIEAEIASPARPLPPSAEEVMRQGKRSVILPAWELKQRRVRAEKKQAALELERAQAALAVREAALKHAKAEAAEEEGEGDEGGEERKAEAQAAPAEGSPPRAEETSTGK